jgi:hypothetical protein
LKTALRELLDINQLLQFSGIFSPLQDLAYFAQVQIHPELGTIIWQNGADLDPDVLYSVITKNAIPTYSRATT